jgi:Fe-S-cluster containining protein
MIEVTRQHATADAYVARCLAAHPELKPCCAAGCFACCSEAVYASEAEVAHIVEILTPAQTIEVMGKLNEWLARTKPLMNQPMPDAIKYRRLNAPCVLLQNGLCSVYERRPFGCRVWFALKNPSDCDLPQREHQKYADFMPGVAIATGIPVGLNGKVMFDHLGALLAEKLLGLKFATASRRTVDASKLKMPLPKI